ncbi:MAG: hypothetical protein ACTHLN_00220, partial [Tepidisphaeraceae bacterium]
NIQILSNDPELTKRLGEYVRAPAASRGKLLAFFRRRMEVHKQPSRRFVFFVSRLETQIKREDYERIMAALESYPSERRWVFTCNKGIPPAEIASRLSILGSVWKSRTLIHETKDGDDRAAFLNRLETILSVDDMAHRILDAYWSEDNFCVWSADLRKIEANIDALSCLKGKAPEDINHFEIDEDGSFIYWPTLDVHMGWEQFAQACDPSLALRAKQKGAEFNLKYGAAIRCVRESAGLKQSDIEGLGERQVGRIERGESRATAKAIAAFAVAHKMNANEYMAAVAAKMQ